VATAVGRDKLTGSYKPGSTVILQRKRDSTLIGIERKRPAMPRNMKIVGFDGPPCPRCGYRTEVGEHVRVTKKELARPFYYTRWFNCRNRDCTTTPIMPDEFKVWNANPAEQEVTTPDDAVSFLRSK
jgi:hypothetical protein